MVWPKPVDGRPSSCDQSLSRVSYWHLGSTTPQGTEVARELLPHDYGHSPFLLNGDYVLASPGRIPQRVRRFLCGLLMSPKPSPHHHTWQDDGSTGTTGLRGSERPELRILVKERYFDLPEGFPHLNDSLPTAYTSLPMQTSHHQCS